ncbi:MAG: Fe-S cluster assembly protein SufD [Solirubrobacteraceae bacterium]|nr:Fe-S cluster assembly protein SufD [Solirubrobacteraceae bacterium]
MASPSTAAAVTEPAWLTARRERAVSLRESLPLPAFRGNPGWEFTSLKDLDLDAYGAPQAVDADADAAGLGVLDMPAGALALEQVDHVYGEPPAAPADGTLVLPLSAAIQSHPDLVERHFGSIVDADDPFVARNEAGWQGGAFVYVPRGVQVEAPIVVTVVQSQAQTALHWRTLVVLEEGAQAEVWEQYVSADACADGDALFSTVTELSVGQNANLRYVCAQGLGERSWIFGAQRAVVERDATLDWIALGFGAGNGRVSMETNLAGRGADAKVTGAYATRGRQHLDYATTQEHAAANTTSDLAFRGILDGRSNTVWSGMIKVDRGAQQIDAFQESRNLLLTKKAHADAIPGLEILANDVRCTHAAAIAQIDPEQLYYLRSRGLSLEQAKRLVIEGFLEATVERFEEGFVRTAVAGALERRLEAVLG